MVKCTLIVLVENQDGIGARIAHWGQLDDNSATPPVPPGLWSSVQNGPIPPTSTNRRNAATRTILKTLFGQFVDTRYIDTPA